MKSLHIINKSYNLKFENIIFLCYNPHCGENKTIGTEDALISSIIKKKFNFDIFLSFNFLYYSERDLHEACQKLKIPFVDLLKEGIYAPSKSSLIASLILFASRNLILFFLHQVLIH